MSDARATSGVVKVFGVKLFTTTKVHFRAESFTMGTTASQLGKDLLSEYQVSVRGKVSKNKLYGYFRVEANGANEASSTVDVLQEGRLIKV